MQHYDLMVEIYRKFKLKDEYGAKSVCGFIFPLQAHKPVTAKQPIDKMLVYLLYLTIVLKKHV